VDGPYYVSDLFSVKPANGIVITDELREELDQAALATQQAYIAVRAAPGEDASFGLPPGVNFTNVLHKAFTITEPKSAKKDSQVTSVFFAIL